MKNRVITEGYPKYMMCWDNNEIPTKRLVICEFKGAACQYRCVHRDSIDDFINGNPYETTWFKHALDIPGTKPRTIQDGLQEGDIVIKSNGKRKVLGVCGSAYMLSGNDFNVGGAIYTLNELILKGWELYSETPVEEPVQEMTMSEVCAALGKNIKIKRND